MDLNEVINIGENKQYNRESVESRRIDNNHVQSFNGRTIISGSELDRLGDNAFIGNINESGTKIYNAQDDLERMKNFKVDKSALANSKMPDFIKESMVSNPLNVDPLLVDAKMSAFTEQLTQKLPGIQKSMGILNHLNNLDEQKKKEQALLRETETQTSSNIDYNLIKSIVESVIDEKLGSLPTLNESVQRNTPGLKVMAIKDKFLYLDDQDNVYECQMVYKGKNKRKKKQ